MDDFFLYNQYRGSAFRTTTTAVRDDEEANVTYRYPVSPDIAVLGRSSWVLSRDSRLVGLSSLERLNGAAGIAVTLPGNLESEAIAGVERTMQLGGYHYRSVGSSPGRSGANNG